MPRERTGKHCQDTANTGCAGRKFTLLCFVVVVAAAALFIAELQASALLLLELVCHLFESDVVFAPCSGNVFQVQPRLSVIAAWF